MIKLFREEVAPHLDLVLTARAPWREGTPRRRRRDSGCRLCHGGGNASTAPVPSGWRASARRPAQFKRRPRRPATLRVRGLHGTRRRLLHRAPAWRPHGVRVLISDLMWPADPVPLLSRLAGDAAALTVIQVLGGRGGVARTPRRPPPEDVESGDYADLMIDTTACAAYAAALARHRESWSTARRLRRLLRGGHGGAVRRPASHVPSRPVVCWRCEMLFLSAR